MTVQDFSHRAHFCGMRWPVRIPKGFPRKYLKGVDRGALEAALELGFPYGGLIPKGRLAEDGIVPEKFDQMTVAPRKDYLFRTEWNVTHIDSNASFRAAMNGRRRRSIFRSAER